MSGAPNPFSKPEPWSLVSAGYAETTMNYLALYGEEAIAWADLGANATVLDVACGPGTLSRLLANRTGSIEAVDFSPEMIRLFETEIRNKKWKHVHAQVADGQHLPFGDKAFDAAFSMFGLMFFPDRDKGFREMFRTLKPGGVAVVSSWAPVSRSPAMSLMFNAMRAADPSIPEPKANITSMENPDIFKSEMEHAGFRHVEVRAFTKPMPADSVDHFWENLVKGSAPIVMMRKKASSDEWQLFEKRAKKYIASQVSHFPATLTSDAWIGKGIKLKS